MVTPPRLSESLVTTLENFLLEGESPDETPSLLLASCEWCGFRREFFRGERYICNSTEWKCNEDCLGSLTLYRSFINVFYADNKIQISLCWFIIGLNKPPKFFKQILLRILNQVSENCDFFILMVLMWHTCVATGMSHHQKGSHYHILIILSRGNSLSRGWSVNHVD